MREAVTAVLIMSIRPQTVPTCERLPHAKAHLSSRPERAHRAFPPITPNSFSNSFSRPRGTAHMSRRGQEASQRCCMGPEGQATGKLAARRNSDLGRGERELPGNDRSRTRVESLFQRVWEGTFRAIRRGIETVIEPSAGGAALAWSPAALERIAANPSSSLWAGIGPGAHHHLFRLEGSSPPPPGRDLGSREV
jgi:hypothetical protein